LENHNVVSFSGLFEVKFSTVFDVLDECRNWRHLPSQTEVNSQPASFVLRIIAKQRGKEGAK
jgi:hypothetical protein